MLGMGGMLMSSGKPSGSAAVHTSINVQTAYGTTKRLRMRVPGGAFSFPSEITAVSIEMQGGPISLSAAIAQCHPNNTSVGSGMEYVGNVYPLGSYSIPSSQSATTSNISVLLDPTKPIILMFDLSSGDQTTLWRADSAGPWETHGYAQPYTSANPGQIITNFGYGTTIVSRLMAFYGD